MTDLTHTSYAPYSPREGRTGRGVSGAETPMGGIRRLVRRIFAPAFVAFRSRQRSAARRKALAALSPAERAELGLPLAELLGREAGLGAINQARGYGFHAQIGAPFGR